MKNTRKSSNKVDKIQENKGVLKTLVELLKMVFFGSDDPKF